MEKFRPPATKFGQRIIAANLKKKDKKKETKGDIR